MKGGKSLIPNRTVGHESSFSSLLLYAALAGDWKKAKRILEKNPELATARITPSGETALHIAAVAAEARHEYFVKKLVQELDDNDLTKRNHGGSTALHLVALAGNVNIAKLMVSKNSKLPTIQNNAELTPLFLAATSGNGEMVEYLLPQSNFRSWVDVKKSEFLNTCIDAGLYGVARQIVECYPILAVARDNNGVAPLDVLARNPSAFSSRSQPRWWGRTTYSLCCKQLGRDERLAEHDSFRLLDRIWQHVPQADIENPVISEDVAGPAFVAAELGNCEFLVELLRQHLEFVYIVNESHYSIYHIAIKNRHESIFSLIYEIGSLKDLVATYRDGEDNTMLHLAARLAPQSHLNTLPGAALQMHRELLWYKEVEKIVPPTYRNLRNKSDCLTPHELFIEQHRELIKEGAKWMKKTAQSCMIVATLIATVVFASAFTVSGRIKNHGEPFLLHQRFFVVFTMAETIAMLSSITSIIMFLCILTSRYTEKDYLDSLPSLLVSGIMTLFISLAGMMVAFSTSLLFYDQQASAKVPMGVFACLPIIFVILKHTLLTDIIGSMHATKRMFRSRQRLISK